MTDQPDYHAALPQRIDIDSGVPGIALTHHITRLLTTPDPDRGIPGDGEWLVTHIDSDRRINHTAFSALHAAAHMAQLLGPVADWTLPREQLEADYNPDGVRHAEAHGHEIDTGDQPATIRMSNGPDIIDEVGGLRKFVAGAPRLDWVKDADGRSVCSVCGALPAGDPT